jgi:hypothetical protein
MNVQFSDRPSGPSDDDIFPTPTGGIVVRFRTLAMFSLGYSAYEP